MNKTINCYNCKKSIDSDSKFCKYCGFNLKEIDYCSECGYALIGNISSCSKCGTDIKKD